MTEKEEKAVIIDNKKDNILDRIEKEKRRLILNDTNVDREYQKYRLMLNII